MRGQGSKSAVSLPVFLTVNRDEHPALLSHSCLPWNSCTQTCRSQTAREGGRVTSHRAGAPGSPSRWAVSRASQAPPTCRGPRRLQPEYTPSQHLATRPRSSCQQAEVACPLPTSDGLHTTALSTRKSVPSALLCYANPPLIHLFSWLRTAADQELAASMGLGVYGEDSGTDMSENTKAEGIRTHARTHAIVWRKHRGLGNSTRRDSIRSSTCRLRGTPAGSRPVQPPLRPRTRLLTDRLMFGVPSW